MRLRSRTRRVVAAPRAVLVSADEKTLYVAEGEPRRDMVRELRAYPIAEDGTFGGRLPLKPHDSGDQMFQWIAGRIEGDRLIIDVEYGAPDRPESFCRGSGIDLKIGG